MQFQRPLLLWYRKGHRELPWRQTKDPYHIWISEIMLQQTRVETVIDYYHRFLQEFPTVQDLAEAPIDQVLKLWEGLGYYSRARNLHKAASQIVENGGFPDTYEGILALSGVGVYTAGAIYSIAFGGKAAAVDGNVLRVVSRLYAISDDIQQNATRQKITDLVEEQLPETAEDRGDFTQSMMELGATVCIPKNPHCEDCPLSEMCEAFQKDLTADLPVKIKKVTQKKIRRGIILVEKTVDGKRQILMHRRPNTGLLKGLWEYPGVDAESAEEIIKAFLAEYGLSVVLKEYQFHTEHIFTHRHWLMEVYTADLLSDEPVGEQWLWADVEEQKALMIPTAFRAIQNALQKNNSVIELKKST